MGRSNRDARDKPLIADRGDPQDEQPGLPPWIDVEPPRPPRIGGGVKVGHEAPPPQSDGEGPDGDVTIDGHQWE